MSVNVPSVKRNNYLQTSNITQQMKYLIFLETFFGINRLYVCGYRKWILCLSYIYGLILHLLVGILVYINKIGIFTKHFYKITTIIEYLLLSYSALLLQRNKLSKFFSSLQTFDDKLNISNEVSLLCPKKWYIYGVIVVISYSVFENLYSIFFIYQTVDVSLLADVNYLPIITHDLEIVFFSYLLITILKRLSVLKAHVAKVFSINVEERIDFEDLRELEVLSKRVNLDVSSVHKLYDLLHKCSEQLNSIMSLSMITMIVTSGLSTIAILKNTIKMIQSTSIDDKHQLIKQSILFVSIGRSLKYILMLAFPCYVINKTKNQVTIIRTMIHDTLNSTLLDKIERRKIKAFYYLVCENQYEYVLYGTVNLDMSLALSYTSLCTTYLIIVVQFSKFFD